jgi:hypothetical protein
LLGVIALESGVETFQEQEQLDNCSHLGANKRETLAINSAAACRKLFGMALPELFVT